VTPQELRDKKGQLWQQAKALNDKAKAEGRVFTAEEQVSWDKMNADMDAFDRQIKVEELAEVRAREFAQTINPGVGRPATEIKTDPNAPAEFRYRPRLAREDRVIPLRASLRSGPEYQVAFARFLRGGQNPLTMQEFRALQADLDISGGYTIPPEQFVARLIQAVDDQVFIRGLATVQTVVNADSLGIPSLDADPADPTWTAEIDTGNEDSTMAFGKRELKPLPLGERIKVSNKLLRASPLSIESMVIQRLAYKFGIKEEKGFLTGNGATEPLGIYTASANGIPTSRDVSTGNSTGDIGADGLIEAKFSIKGNYWPRLRWNFHRDAVKRIRKLKDGDGQYLWGAGLNGGESNTILGVPVDMSEYTPNTFNTGLYVGCIGDFSNYWIADALSVTFQRLVELYAATNQTGFIARLECDGMPVLGEAFARVKLA
jgi:HK97 family phage major capsid protein